MQELDLKSLNQQLHADAHALGIPSGAADAFIERTLTDALRSLKSRTIITDQDLTRAIVKELQKYHANLAYVYENRDKII